MWPRQNWGGGGERGLSWFEVGRSIKDMWTLGGLTIDYEGEVRKAGRSIFHVSRKHSVYMFPKLGAFDQIPFPKDKSF